MAEKGEGEIRGQITDQYKMQSQVEIAMLKSNTEYASRYGVRSIGDNGGYVAVSVHHDGKLRDDDGNLTNFGKEMFVSEAVARDGWRIRLTNDGAVVSGEKMPDGLANMKHYEIKSPVAQTTEYEKNIRYALRKAEKNYKTQVVALYMGKETVAKVHREHICRAIDLYTKRSPHRFETIVVVDVKGNTYYWKH